VSETTTEILTRTVVKCVSPDGMQVYETQWMQVQVLWPNGKPSSDNAGQWVMADECAGGL
jgi:hypothetical protein